MLLFYLTKNNIPLVIQKLVLPTPLPQRTKRSSGAPGYVGQPLVLGSACIDKLFKFICFGAGFA
jgi:hypothetical protein